MIGAAQSLVGIPPLALPLEVIMNGLFIYKALKENMPDRKSCRKPDMIG